MIEFISTQMIIELLLIRLLINEKKHSILHFEIHEEGSVMIKIN